MAKLKGFVKGGQKIQAKAMTVGSAGRFIEMADVDPVDLGDGATVIYNETTEKFELRREIKNPNTKIIGGSF